MTHLSFQKEPLLITIQGKHQVLIVGSPISTNLGLTFNQGFLIPLFKSLFLIIS